MKKATFLIIEADPVQAQEMSTRLAQLPINYALDTCQTAAQALDRLTTTAYDLILMDISLTGLADLNLLTAQRSTIPVIVVASTSQQAASCYDLNVRDYLLKPVEPARFQRALMRTLVGKQKTIKPPPLQSIYLPAKGQTQHYFFKDIYFIEAYGASSRLHTLTGTTVVNVSISILENLLPGSLFKRIQKLYIVNLTHIHSMDSRSVWIGTTHLRVEADYGESLKKLLKGVEPL